MAKTTRKAGKPATATGRDELRARKPAMAKTRDGKSRKPKPARPGPRKGKPSLPSETASLKRQLKTARLQQQASAEILRAVANASGDVARPLQQIAETTARLFKASSVSIQLAEDTEFTQEYRVGAIAKRVGSAYPRSNIRVGGRNLPGTVVAESRQIHIPDLDRLDPSMSDFPGLPHARAGGARTVCGTPLRREDKAIGALIVFRDRLLPFIDDELALLQSFADQAVIAIENARLFNNTQEALARQTASADILRVISQSPTDVQPVFDAIALAAVRLLGCERAFIQRCDGASFWTVSWCGPEGQLPILNASPIPIDPEANFPSRAISENRTLHLPDWSVIDLPEFEREIQKRLGINSALYMPLLREGECIGLLAMAGKRTNIFGASEIALAESFRDQALIAIENTRLFNETREALERQTATAEILKVIASSPSDVQPVFNAVVLTARRLLGREMAAILLCGDDAAFRAVAGAGPDGLIPIDPAFAAPTKIDPEANFPSRAIVSKKNLHLPDWSAIDLPEQERNIRKMVGWNSTLYLPMLRGDECIGVLLLGGTQPGIFNEADIALAESFRDQALIAIENTRLFNETREALERQTATADILKVIASSPDDAQPVFEAIAEQSKRLVEALSTTVFRLEDGLMHLKAYTPTNPEADATLRAGFPAPLARFSWGPAISHGDVYRVLDTEQEIESLRQLARLRGFRSMLFVPLLRDGTPIGVIAVTRVEPGPFVEHHVQLLQTFADQAVIAIGNVRLFEEVQAKTHELSRSLDELRTAQDRLVQTEKLASLGQLTAGIAHEIKNPLNFVNNFSALSAELVDEMTEVFENPALDETARRKELDEIRALLKSNLEKVVQHGKRADSIVKNMLLHSREGSGEQRPADINALLDESLNLAYHGARAEKPEFNITLRRDLDPDAGTINVFPQEITRAFINLISNGFYAASKRKAENGEADFEPVLSAATKNLGNHIEIRIRDNGTGIPPEVKDKIFNPFFTTKPSGEGTGLGLSMSHDIIVKQHGGSIDVETEPGLFTEFKIVLPRPA